MFDMFNLIDGDYMFESFDDKEKCYEIVLSDKTSTKVTTQELYEFLIFTETNITEDFKEVKKKLDAGHAVFGDHLEWDWSMGYNTYKGKLSITRITPPKIPSQLTNNSNSSDCRHENRYINQAGGFKFWVCPKCKKDLGDA